MEDVIKLPYLPKTIQGWLVFLLAIMILLYIVYRIEPLKNIIGIPKVVAAGG